MALFDLRLKKLDQDIAHASSYQAYQEACLAHDEISGAEAWKADDASDDYDYILIQKLSLIHI